MARATKNIAAEEHVRAARARAAFLRPYFGHALYALIPREAPECPTMAIDKHGRLYYSPEFVLACSVEEIATVCIHEIGHKLRRHHERAVALGINEATFKIANIAMDCFPAGTMLGDGLPIEAPRTQTIGGNGGATACTNLTRPWDGEVVTLKGAGVEITSTPEHPHWIYQRRHKVGLTPVRLKEPAWLKANEVRVGDFMLVPDVGGDFADTTLDMTAFGGAENRSPLKNGFPLNEQTAWLLGLYTAEGSRAGGEANHAQLSLGYSPKELALADRASTIARSLGYEGNYESYSSRDDGSLNNTRVNIGGPVVARAFAEWCGGDCYSKRCPDFILRNADTKIVRAYLEGLVAGDGSVVTKPRSNYICLDTSSRGLAAQVRLLLARLGVGFWGQTTIQRDRYIGERFIKGGTKIYKIGWTWEPKTTQRTLNGKTVTAWSRSWRRCPEGILIPIKSISRSHFKGNVYNLSCDKEHTFIAEGVKTHNCELNDDLAEEVEQRKDLASLPPGAVYPSTFGLPNGHVWEWYYDKLMDMAQPSGGGSNGPRRPGAGGGKGSNNPRDREFDCGSGAHDQSRPWEDPAPRGQKDDVEGVDDADWRDIEERVAKEIKEEAKKSRGTVPGSWIEWADGILRPQKINWEHELAGAVRWAVNEVSGKVIHNYKRPSRRQQATPDVVFPCMRRPVPSVAFVGDTSGSMSSEALKLVRGVVEDVCQAVGASLSFIATDAAAHGVQRAVNGRNIEMRGRGGTDMRVGIEAALEDVRPRPDVIIVGSDCETPWPAEEPGARMIICAIEANDEAVSHCPEWARVIRVTTEEEA